MRAALIAIALAPALLLSPAARAEDNEAPQISYTPPAPGTSPKGAFTVTAKVTDESKFYPQLFFRYGPGAYEKPVDMRKGKAKDLFEATIPYKTATIEFYIEAYDEIGNGPGRAGDPEKPFKVTLGEAAAPAPAPTAAAPPPSKASPAAPAPKPSAPAKSTAGTSHAASSGGGGGRVWTWVVGGAGVGLLAGGLLAGMAMTSSDDAYKQTLASTKGQVSPAQSAALQAQLDANKSLGTKATILTISGAVLLAGSVGLFFLEAPSSSSGHGDAFYGEVPASDPGAGVRVAATPVEGGAAAVIAGRF